ncbi:MAG: MFS transporter [Alphaproteobacteria bacterium]
MSAKPMTKRPGLFGMVKSMTAEERRVVLLVSIAFILIQYDHALYGIALAQIQQDLGWSDDNVGAGLSIIRLGAIPAIILAAMADKVGRRKLLIATMILSAVATLGTSLVQTPEQFVMAQFWTKSFAFAEEALSIVVVAESVRPHMRGWAVGFLASMGGLGSGLASIAFGFVDVLPFGWRALYVLGIGPLLLVAWLRRSLPETQKFAADHPDAEKPKGGLFVHLQPVVRLVRDYPGRAMALAACVAPFGLAVTPAVLFMSKYLQEGHGFSPDQVGTTYLLGGVFAIFGNLLAGWLSDRVGRKPTITFSLFVTTGGFFLLYGLSDIPVLAVSVIWVFAIFGYFSGEIMYNALGSELFPTSYRSTASTFRLIVYTVSGSIGLLLQSVLYTQFGLETQETLMILLMGTPISIFVTWLLLPETANRDLDEIAPEVVKGL